MAAASVGAVAPAGYWGGQYRTASGESVTPRKPWRKPEIYRASPISKYEVAGIPLVTLAGVIFGGFLAFCIYKWFTDDAYGVNHSPSLRYMLVLYAIAPDLPLSALAILLTVGGLLSAAPATRTTAARARSSQWRPTF